MSKIKFILINIFLISTTLFAQYTKTDIYNYIDNYKELAITKMSEYKIPASITLAQGILESGAGTSRLAKYANNHFGIKCHKEWIGDTILLDDDALQECFRKYDKVEDSFSDHSLFLTTRNRYSPLFQLDIMDYKEWAKTLKICGYATNPKYPDILINLIDNYHLTRFDSLYKAENNVVINQNSIVKPKLENSIVQNINGNVFLFKPNTYTEQAYPFTDRKVYENNKTYFVVAKKGDDYAAIAKDLQLKERQLKKYNDVSGNANLCEGEVVYVEKKNKNSLVLFHDVKKGETLRYISQKYAIQLNILIERNNIQNSNKIQAGSQLLIGKGSSLK